MPRSLVVSLFLIALVAGCARPRPVLGPDPESPLLSAPPGMSEQAWTHARSAYHRVRAMGLLPRPILAIIDFTLPSIEPRLWVVDMQNGALLMHEYVAHGWASGGTWATEFSNRRGSNQSSLGVFLAGDRYVGVRGLSVRLHGLEPGINDRARERGLVVHGSPYVTAWRAERGNLGRTEGCPAVPARSAPALVKLLEGGGVLYAWYPDPAFLARSTYAGH